MEPRLRVRSAIGSAAATILAIGLLHSPASGGPPSPDHCTVTPLDNTGVLFLSGDYPATFSWSVLDIVVRDASNQPIANCSVYLDEDLDQNGETMLCYESPYYYSDVTNGSGEAMIVLAGGGCDWDADNEQRIYASNVLIRSDIEYWRSPDWDGSAGNGLVNVADLAKFADEFKGTYPAKCHDYYVDGYCSTQDLPFFADTFLAGAHCSSKRLPRR